MSYKEMLVESFVSLKLVVWSKQDNKKPSDYDSVLSEMKKNTYRLYTISDLKKQILRLENKVLSFN
jgi:hypothetical protein